MHGVESGLAELRSGRLGHKKPRFGQVLEINIGPGASQPPQCTQNRRSLGTPVKEAQERVANGSLGLLQAELSSSRQQGEGFANALFPRFRPHGGMNPSHKVTPVAERQFLKETLGSRICLQRLGDIRRQAGDRRARGVCVDGWRCRQAGRGQEPACLEFDPAFAVTVRPLAGGLSRRELSRVSVFVEPLNKTIDPSEAERLTNRVLVCDRLDSRVIFMEREPDTCARRMMLS